MSKPKNRDYEIGYGRPPRHSQFKKGASGNPKGRRKGVKSLLDLLSEALDEIIIVKENGLTRKIRKRDAIMKQLVNKAVSGDVRSLKVVLEALGPNSERGRKEELEQSYREGTTASERVARKLEQLRERLRARQSLVPEGADDPEVPEDADDSKKSEKAVGPKKW